MMMHGFRLSSQRVVACLTSTAHGTRRFFATKEVIINAVASDRVGIVSELTKYVTDVGGNVGESQASRLGSHFSIMMLVHIPENKVVALVDQLEDVENITASVHMVQSKESPISNAEIAYSGKFTLEGADNVGIVHRVTSILAQHGLCIDKMQTSDEMAPYGGTTLFRMKGIAHAYQPVAAGFDVTKVKTELEQLGEDLNCDIDMVDLAPGEEVDVDSA